LWKATRFSQRDRGTTPIFRSGFSNAAVLGGDGSIVEGLRVFGVGCPCFFGISATGIVKGNIVVGIEGPLEGLGLSITATGIVTGNYVIGSRGAGYSIGEASTGSGNTAPGRS
jgi:hypothetical protein